jgi:hypothetical protein
MLFSDSIDPEASEKEMTMWTPGGQIDKLTFAGLRGGGKGGGGGGRSDDGSWMKETTLVDPVTGEAYTSSPWSMYQGGKSASDQLNERIRARKGEEQQASTTAAQAAAEKTATDTVNFQGKRQSAYDTALQDTMRAFQNQGVDPNAYRSTYIDPALNRINAGIADLDPNPMGAFPTSLGDTIVNQATSDRRSQLKNQYDAIFNPNYSSTVLPDSTTSSYIDQILGEQFDPLSAQLTNAQKRHTLTDVGYNAALGRLDQKKAAARDTVSNLGANILSGYRSSLDDLIGRGRSDIAGLGLSNQFDPNAYTSKAQNLVNTDLSNFGGALRNAVGGSEFASLSDLINTGGAVQGATNPTAANPRGGGGPTGMTPDEELASKKRGLGNTGAF